MKKIIILVPVFFLLFTACKPKLKFRMDKKETYTSGVAGMEKFKEELDDKFGKEAFYTELSIMSDKTAGNVITATTTKKPSSLELEQWSSVSGNWSQTATVTLEIDGGKPEDFMFNLTSDISLKKLGELIELSKTNLTKDKKIENPRTKMATVILPSTVENKLTDLKYMVILEPENGGTSFTYTYDLQGKLISMDY